MTQFKVGDKVVWRCMQGGYGYIFCIPAIVVKVTAKRVAIEFKLAQGGAKQVSVKPESLRLRGSN